jgi:hypothetical protein
MFRTNALMLAGLAGLVGMLFASPARAVDDLSLNVAAGSETVAPGDTVTVTLDVANLSAAINGVQIRIQYNTTLMTLIDVVPNAGFNWTEVSQSNNAGNVDWAATINGGSTSADHTVATLTFTAIAEGVTSVTFRPDNDPFYTKLTRESDNGTILPNKTDSGSITLTCDDGNPCTTDTVVSQVCSYSVAPAGTLCRASTDECDPAEFCDGVTTTCPEDSFLSDGTSCTDDGSGCTNDICESGVCSHPLRPLGFVCRASAGECDLEETCDGVAADCPADDFVAAGTPCTDQTPGDCDAAQCDGNGVCDQAFDVEPNGYVCRSDNGGGCDVAETCDGIFGGACPLDEGVSLGTVCRVSAGECDIEETCDGTSAPCPADAFVAAATPCTDLTLDDCDAAQCDGSGSCDQAFGVEPNGYICRSDNGGGCDVAETCDGVSGGACPLDEGVSAGTVCRPSLGECDVEETCDGTSAPCPVDGFVAAGTSCTDLTPDDCDAAQCDGAGACDQAFDVEANGYVCRPDNGGGCDVADTCDGIFGGACPPDEGVSAGTVCRSAVGECDVEETCDGTSAPCPADAFVAAATPCTDLTPDDCDAAQCDGSGSCDQAFDVEPSGYVCRADNGGGCDVAETCDGIFGGACPSDEGVVAGTVCRPSVGECDVEEACDGTSAPCPADDFVAAGTPCTDLTPDDCDAAQCDGAGACDQAFDVEPSGLVCRASTDECDPAETCNGIDGGSCPPDDFLPDGTACTSDGDACTADECVSGVCMNINTTPVGDCCDPVTGDLTPIDDFDACTNDICNPDGTVTHQPGGEIEVFIKLQAVSNAVTRDVTFAITTCSGGVDVRTLPVAFNSVGNGSIILTNVDAEADWIGVSEGHALRRLAAVSFTSCEATVDVSGANLLIAGDFHTASVPKDNLVDITDFSILASRWNQAIDPNASEGADATGNGLQNTGDFTAIQANFFLVGDPIDACPVMVFDDYAGGGAGERGRFDELQRVSRDDPPVLQSRIAVDRDLFPETVEADMNGDGFVDGQDVRLFAARHRIRLSPELDRTLRQLEREQRGKGGRR